MSIALPKPFRSWLTPVRLRWVVTLPFLFTAIGVVVWVAYLGLILGRDSRLILMLSLLLLGGPLLLAAIALYGLVAHLEQLIWVSQQWLTGQLEPRLPTDQAIVELNTLFQTLNQVADRLQYDGDRSKTNLKEFEAKFTTIFHASPEPMAIASLAEGRILDANESLLHFFDYSRADVIGRTVLELNFWADLNQYANYRCLLEQQGSIRNLEVQLQTRLGMVKTVLLSVEVRVLNEQDCLIVRHQDISDRRATERLMQQSETRYRALLQSIPDLFIHMDQQGRYLQVLNPGGIILSNPANSIPGKTLYEVLPELLAGQRMGYIQMALQTRKPQSYEYTIEVQGRIQYEEARITPCDDDTVLIIVRDISERVRLEMEQEVSKLALQTSEARYRAIVEDQTELICRVASDFTLLFVNDAYCRYFGVQRQDVLGQSYDFCIYASDLDSVAHQMRSLSAANPTLVVEHRVVINDVIRWIQWTVRLLFDDQGTVAEIQAVGRDITELKQTEEALRQSDLRFRQLAEAVREGFFVFEVDSASYSYLNSACISITGMPFHESQALQESAAHAKGMSHWFSNIHPDDRAQIEAALQREREGENFNQEYRFLRPDGEIRWLRSQAFPIHDETGKVVRIVGTVNDITERKQLEQSLRSQAEEERLLATITQNIRQSLELDQILATTVVEVQQTLQVDRVLIFRLNPDGSGQVIQEAVVPMFPVTDQMRWKDECLLSNSCDYYLQGQPRIVPDVATDSQGSCLAEFMQQIGVKSKLVAPIVQCLGESTAKLWGLLIVHSCSRYRSWQASEANFLQRICSQLAIAIDQADLYHQLQTELAERRQAEAALRCSEELFRSAFDNAPIGISLVAANGCYLKANTHYCNLLGYTEAELLSMTFQEMTHPGDLPADLKAFRSMIDHELSCYQMEKRYLSKQGTMIPVLLNAAPVYDQTGELLYCVGHIQDIRDRLKVERMKDEFVAVVSHELRTPLTSIKGALDILGTGIYNNRPEKAKRMLEIAITNSDRLVRLVNDILTLERLESGKVQLVMEACQVSELMQQSVDSVQAIADQASITLALTPLTATLWAAPDAVIQTLINLLGNAIKFSSPGDTVWLQADVSSGATAAPVRSSPSSLLSLSSSLLFVVQDQGRGIPQDKLETIFEEFQQVDASDSRKKGGTGLGLAICKNIVQQHRGQIWVESALGQGSTFYVALPWEETDDHH